MGGSPESTPGPGRDLPPAVITMRTTYTMPEMPPNRIPTSVIHVWWNNLSSPAPISQPTKADDGSSTATCIIFSASTSEARGLEDLGRWFDSGIGRLKGIQGG